MICNHCGEKGHYATNCKKRQKELIHTTIADSSNDDSDEVEHIFDQHITGVLCNTWLLLDNQSMVDQFVNPTYLHDIKSVGKHIDVYCNAGKTSTNQQGMFRGIKVWCNLLGIADVISLKTIKSMFRGTYDSDNSGGVFMVHITKGCS